MKLITWVYTWPLLNFSRIIGGNKVAVGQTTGPYSYNSSIREVTGDPWGSGALREDGGGGAKGSRPLTQYPPLPTTSLQPIHATICFPSLEVRQKYD